MKTEKSLPSYAVYFSILLYVLLFFVTLNWYRYGFDVDGVGYMTVARRVAHGEWMNSINGLWSPLNSWLAAPFINESTDVILLFKIINAFTCCGIIFLVHLLAKKQLRSGLLHACILLILPPLLLSYTHHQLAGDLLQLFFLLIYLLLITSENFFRSLRANLAAGIIMAAAYLAKSYSLPFFIVNHCCIFFLFYIFNRDKTSVGKLLKPLAASFSVFLLIVLPWVYCLYLKYHLFTFSMAGSLNYNWSLGNSAATIKYFKLLMPPPYPDSPAYWEDPAFYFHSYFGPLHSLKDFISACKLFLQNTFLSVQVFAEISFFLLPLFLYRIARIILGDDRKIYFKEMLIICSCFVLTAGYLLLHIESRYVWLCGMLGLIMGAASLEKIRFNKGAANLMRFLVYAVFFSSFLFFAANRLKDLANKGKDLQEIKKYLYENRTGGRFSGNPANWNETDFCTVLAYVADGHFYLQSRRDFSEEELLEAIQENKLQFYLYFYHSEMEKELLYNSRLAKAAKRIFPLPGKEIMVLGFE